MSAPILKLCPFCGGDAYITHRDGCAPWRFVTCAVCSACSAQDTTDDDVARRWNRRGTSFSPTPSNTIEPIGCHCTTQSCCSECARRELAPPMSDGELIARAIMYCSALLAMTQLSGVEGAELLADAGKEEAELIEAELRRREAERKVTP